ncbi:MAG: sigma 54-interacting transcriptional regulator [Deltaproteobacteria bacterium]|nr:sigma 54-interacting transcriptional regulator [Deltaproteobacteria bacterium]
MGIIVLDEAMNIQSCNESALKIVKNDLSEIDWNKIKYIFKNKVNISSDHVYKETMAFYDIEVLCCFTCLRVVERISYILILCDYSDGLSSGRYLADQAAPSPPLEKKRALRSKIIRPGKYSFDDIIGESRVLTDLKKRAFRIAQGDSTVVITGESGTGKELFAQSIHDAGLRKHAPFVRVNCGSIPETLLESELFGYEPGSFTGAEKKGKKGKFEIAHNGTIFLDEAGDMSLGMQAKILRVIQDCEFERIGGSITYEIDVRFIAATNKNLWELVQEGAFREDLYYRMDVVNLHIPPLRERREDIPLLVESFVPEIRRRVKTQTEKISDEVLAVFCDYDWPGNVRELKNTLESMMNMESGCVLGVGSLPPKLLENKPGLPLQTEAPGGLDLHMGEDLQALEKRMIERALYLKKGNKRQAARHLNMPRSTFYNKLKKYNIQLEDRPQ